jgi:molybdenum cofactor cytidylyltransferase
MGDVVGVVLGAGSSARLGRPKQLLPFGELTLLGHVLADVESAASLDRVVLVLGAQSEPIRASLRLARATVVTNAAYGSGCASSLLAGLDAAGDCDAIVLLLGDMPGVTAGMIDDVVGQWRTHESWAAVTQYTTGVGHPFVFSEASFTELRALHGDKAVWKIVDREPPERVARLGLDRPLPDDVDTWHDYVAACERLGLTPAPARAEGNAAV